ncbi:MAG: hypothetical protein WCV79_03395 [Candidatus Paceibacterota bacterium]|jgi:hypothetical protein
MKINIAIVTSVFVLSAFFLGNSEIAFACTPIYRTAQQSLNGADLVFQGKVISTATSTQVFVYDGTSVPTKVSTMDFQVEKFWKGSPTERVTVKSTAPDGYSCPVFIPKAVGMEYLVYANKDVNSNSYVVGYTEIKEIASATVDLNLLGNSKTLNAEVKTNVSVTPIKSNPTPNVVARPAEKPVTSVNVQTDSQSNVVETQSDVMVEVKKNFIQKIFSWLGGFFK